MKILRHAVGCITIASLGVVTLGLTAQTVNPPASSTPVTDAAGERALLNQYCVTCHNQKLKTADLELDQLDTAHVADHAEKWELVVRKLRSGMMPPSGMPRPAWATYESMVEWLEGQLDKNASTHLPPPGLHRMNRTEYANVIHDMLALDIDPTKYLPSDDSTRGFDNIAGALALSPALLEGYTSAAAKISRIAMGDVNEPTLATYRVASDTTQDYHIEGLPFGTRGGLVVQHEFPADGDYVFKVFPINKGLMDNSTAFGEITGEKLELLVDGQRIRMYDWDKEIARGKAVHGGTTDLHFQVKAGPHTVGVTFLATQLAPSQDLDEHFLRSTIETGGLPGFKFYPHVGKMEILGPFKPAGASDSPSVKKIYVCHPANASEETACAKKIVETLVRHAFRRPVTPQDTETLMTFYQQGRNDGTFGTGIERALQRVLADPEFVFRKEAEPEKLAAGQSYHISDLELASRLSFFLWSSIPDDELIDAAAKNKLHEPAVLEAQVRRMLADSRADRLVINFAGQWLNLRALQTWAPTVSLFPDFDDNLRLAMRKETELFVGSVVHEDRSVIDLLDAKYTFINERLAKHYGIPGVYGSDFRRVDLPAEFDVRRGLLGQASIETLTSYPQRTTPTVRGKAIMQIFLGVSPPDPPPNVPTLKDQGAAVHGGAKPTMRQQIEMHRKNAPCSTCHRIMDPIGLSMENFDAVGTWRTTDNGSPIDPSGVLVDGSKLDGVKGLREAMLRYSPQFVRVVTEKLFIYALGRGTEYYDMPLIRSIVHDSESKDYRFSSLILGIVKSEPFQVNQKQEITSNVKGPLADARASEPRP
jgi:mono/diheme cytochrome c family protein